jgi:hypothetical protein
MAESVRIIGSYLSPYVRKVLAVLHVKGVDYRIDVIERTLAHDAFARLRPFEDLCIRTPIAGQRAALLKVGAPLTDESWGTDELRAGVMPI